MIGFIVVAALALALGLLAYDELKRRLLGEDDSGRLTTEGGMGGPNSPAGAKRGGLGRRVAGTGRTWR